MTPLRSDPEWQFWGQHDPLYAVATIRDKHIGGEAAWTAEEFLENGRRYFVAVRTQWQQYGMGAEHCVEIGSGSGRITGQLARHFRRVTGLDVSSAQIATAQRLLGTETTGVQFMLVSDPVIPLPDGSCDAVFSCEVFQHFDDDEGLNAYVREAHRVLQSGGTLCFQLPLRGLQPRSLLASPLRNMVLRLLRRLGRRRMMIYRTYEASAVFERLQRAGFASLELRVFKAEGHGRHCYFFATKPTSPATAS